jgi:hypothetical protein
LTRISVEQMSHPEFSVGITRGQKAFLTERVRQWMASGSALSSGEVGGSIAAPFTPAQRTWINGLFAEATKDDAS